MTVFLQKIQNYIETLCCILCPAVHCYLVAEESDCTIDHQNPGIKLTAVSFLVLPCQCYLEDAVSSYVWGQASQALFPWSSDSHKQGITIDSFNDSWDLSEEEF